ncbi:LysE/ArgO family amino acid transporter [Microbacterium sp. Marseille-Q6965]|uniref:LysE/ArgO family amino acid transporter n=1 Tax=Microbacterium sp. Marseille-Q6965 TaxID=2965072 RepID=UPI0021B70B8A|nr:LysE family transporter [Microbacterium sp. Marseille-Q6965]
MLPAFFSGLGIGLSLIVAIGAQNAFLLRQAAKREHIVALTLFCIVSDLIFIGAATGAVGYVASHAPWVLEAARWAGVVFLACYGALAARRAWRPSGEVLEAAPDAAEPPAPAGPGGAAVLTRQRRGTLAAALLTCAAMTWLNPHLWLDTAMLGSIANTFGEARWVFTAGAITGSTIWFATLAVAATLLGRYLRTPRAWRILDTIIAVVMLGLAIRLAIG